MLTLGALMPPPIRGMEPTRTSKELRVKADPPAGAKMATACTRAATPRSSTSHDGLAGCEAQTPPPPLAVAHERSPSVHSAAAPPATGCGAEKCIRAGSTPFSRPAEPAQLIRALPTHAMRAYFRASVWREIHVAP